MLNLRDSHLADLYSSGIADDLIERAQFRSADRIEVTQLLGFDAGSGGLVIPYPGDKRNAAGVRSH
jgi:hypothetical protein